uniref:WD40 repeat domain 95 n=1 Tax=Stegastes partitus TaxID=144197 RepID=A0A3B5ACJ7_9TELE
MLCSAFDLCQKHSLLVTGGMDRLIRLWNPHFSGKPTGILKGHSAPIIFLFISSEDSQIFSVSTDNTVKVIRDSFLCPKCSTIHPKASGIHGDISACSYSPAVKCLYVAADCLAVLSLKPRLHSRLMASHNEPVMCCGFSEEFRQVVSCSEGSVVRVWDFDTGRQVFEFGGTHRLSSITCMTFDPSSRRLITGARDGCLKIWNFNSGQCLQTLKKGDIPEDSHHVQRPQPSWQDDLKSGHKDDILCVAQCPPSLLATSSYDGEIIVWNVISGSVQCRLVCPLAAQRRDVEGDYWSLKNLKVKQLSLTTALLSSGAKGQDCVWEGLRQMISVGEMLPGVPLVLPEMPSPISSSVSLFWSSLQIVDNDQVVLTSSTDHTVRLWSAQGEFIGTFGQPESWNVHIPSSWMHPGVPFEVLIDPLSMPDHEILNAKTCHSDAMNPDRAEADRGEPKKPCSTYMQCSQC